MLYLKRFFAGVWGAFFKKKSAPQVKKFRNIILEKSAGGAFFDAPRASRLIGGSRYFLLKNPALFFSIGFAFSCAIFFFFLAKKYIISATANTITVHIICDASIESC